MNNLIRLLCAFGLLALTSSAAHALSHRDSWEKIFGQRDLIYMFEENLGGMALDNVCMTDTELHSLRPYKWCPKLVPIKAGENKDRYTDWRCEKWAFEHNWYPRTVMKSYCTEYQNISDNVVCVREEPRPVTVPDTIKVNVTRQFGSRQPYVGFQKMFTFPRCD